MEFFRESGWGIKGQGTLISSKSVFPEKKIVSKDKEVKMPLFENAKRLEQDERQLKLFGEGGELHDGCPEGTHNHDEASPSQTCSQDRPCHEYKLSRPYVYEENWLGCYLCRRRG